MNPHMLLSHLPSYNFSILTLVFIIFKVLISYYYVSVCRYLSISTGAHQIKKKKKKRLETISTGPHQIKKIKKKNY